MARSVSYRFFLTPGETVDVVERVASATGLHVFVQLERPGLVVERLGAVRDVLTRSEMPPRLLLTHRQLPTGSEPGTFDGFGVPGLILVSVPFVEGDRFYLGSAGAKFVDDKDAGAAAARALVRQLKRQASHKLLARNIKTGATGPASCLGCSEDAMQLVESRTLGLRQLAVENIAYLPVGLESRR